MGRQRAPSRSTEILTRPTARGTCQGSLRHARRSAKSEFAGHCRRWPLNLPYEPAVRYAMRWTNLVFWSLGLSLGAVFRTVPAQTVVPLGSPASAVAAAPAGIALTTPTTTGIALATPNTTGIALTTPTTSSTPAPTATTPLATVSAPATPAVSTGGPSIATSGATAQPGVSAATAPTAPAASSAPAAAVMPAPSLSQQEFWQCSSVAATADTLSCLDLL
jgi:hypothetical protein